MQTQVNELVEEKSNMQHQVLNSTELLQSLEAKNFECTNLNTEVYNLTETQKLLHGQIEGLNAKIELLEQNKTTLADLSTTPQKDFSAPTFGSKSVENPSTPAIDISMKVAENQDDSLQSPQPNVFMWDSFIGN